MVPILLVVIICILCPPLGVVIGVCLIGLALCMLICTLFEGLLSVLRVGTEVTHKGTQSIWKVLQIMYAGLRAQKAVQAIVLVAAAILGWAYLYGPLLRAIT